MIKYQQVALVSIPKQDLIRPPAALPILAAICEDVGCDYSVYDLNLWLYRNMDRRTWHEVNDNWMKIDSVADTDQLFFKSFQEWLDKFVSNMLMSKPDLVAISVFTHWSSHCACELVSAIKKQDANVKIVIGGSGINGVVEKITGNMMISDWLLQQGLLDYYIHGEGELLFKNLLLGQDSGPGLNNHSFTQIDNLDQFTYPSYNKIDPSVYEYIASPSVMINGSRGCVRHCTYCDVSRYWPKFRYKSGNIIAEEIYHTWQQTGIVSYEFSDSLINGSIKEFRKMNQRLVELKQQNKDFQIEYKGQFICRSPKQFKETDYHLMSEAGCNYLYVGVETFSESVRYDMDKKFDNLALDFHLRMCARYGIPNVFLMIVGYPTETQEDHKKNLQGLKQYQVYAQSGVIEMITFGFTTSIIKDTPLYMLQESLGIVPEFEHLKNNNDYNSNWISLKNADLTFNERVKRWVELTELANELGYQQSRINAIVKRLEQQMLQIGNQRKQIIPIKVSIGQNDLC